METDFKSTGRPKMLSEDMEKLVRGTFPDLTTERSVNNRVHAFEAFCQLCNDDRFEWLTQTKGQVPRWGILTELGRLYLDGFIDDDDLKRLAESICEQQPKTRDCARVLKQQRLGRHQQFHALILSETVSKTIAEYYHAAGRELTPEGLDTILANVRHMLFDTDDD